MGVNAIQLHTLVGASQTLEAAMVEVLLRSPILTESSGRMALARLVARWLNRPLPSNEPVALAPKDHLSRIVEDCADEASAGQGTDTLARAVALVTGDAETTTLMRVLSDWQMAKSRLTERDLSTLERLLTGTTTSDVRTIARLSLRPYPVSLPAHCRTAWSVLLFLLRRNALPSGLPPFLVFLEHLSVSLIDTAQSELRQWTLEHSRKLGLEAELAACREQIVDAPSITSPEHRLMFVLLPDGLDESYCILRFWHQDGSLGEVPALRNDDARVHKSDLPRVVQARLRQTLPLDSHRECLIEFWLTVSLANLPVSEWCHPGNADTWPDDCRVIVRSLDRAFAPAWHPSWKRRWSSLVEARPQDSVASDEDVRDSASSPSWTSTEVRVLSAPPDATEGQAELMDAIASGVPAVLWHRRDCSSARFHEQVQGLLAQGPLAELPARVGRLQHRSESLEGLTLMWDDPGRPLPGLIPLTAPDEVAAQ